MRVDILGVQVDAITREHALNKIKEFLSSNKTNIVTTTYSEFIVAAQKDEKFKNILNNADLNLADGIGILWAASFLNLHGSSLRGGERSETTKQSQSRLLRSLWSLAMTVGQFLQTAYYTAFNQEKIKDIIPEQIAGADLIFDICNLAQHSGASVFLLGGHGPINEVLKQKYPNLKIAGRYEGNPDEQGIVDKINQSGADILLVAFGPIKQEYWLWNNKETLRVKLAVGLGGTFDYVLGMRQRAGAFWQRHGLEWLYRLITQPWRARRMWNAIVVFSWLILKNRIK